MDPQALFNDFKTVVTEHYIDFDGRVARAPFWYYVLVYVVIALGLAIVDAILSIRALNTLYSLALFLPTLGITVRRLHDTDKSGWWVLLGAVPAGLSLLLMVSLFTGGMFGFLLIFAGLLPLVSLVAVAVLIYFCAQPGTAGANQFGADPKGGAVPVPAA